MRIVVRDRYGLPMPRRLAVEELRRHAASTRASAGRIESRRGYTARCEYLFNRAVAAEELARLLETEEGNHAG
jgi:hypothetical protein